MIIRVKDRKKKKAVLDLMEPLIARWFDGRFEHLTEPQGYAIPLIHERKNVLVSSPTGSGKTLTGFLAIINELFKLDKKGELEDRIYCVYVSPLRALANDIHKNLEEPLEEIREMAKEEEVKVPEIRTAIRSGDTPQSERRKMVLKPPHILITTPESLALILSSPRFRESFDGVQYFIMDEIHDICSSKRGSFLSLNVERLQAHVKSEMTRIGLSATQAPIEAIGEFLGGYHHGEPRDVNIIEVLAEKRLDLSVISPVDDMTRLPYEVVNSYMYDLLKGMVDDHRTTLIFTNTRSGAESVSYKLQERQVEDIAAHHGSLSKETRLTVEEDLREGELVAAVSSTSLELGIDVGYIDLVLQVGSPKSVAKGLQRVGRAGHGVGQTSKGRLIVFEKDDLVECTVLTREALHHNIDRVNIPENNLDVLAQTLVGMSIEKRWDVDEAFTVVKNSYCYRDLKREDYLKVLDYLGGRGQSNIYSKIWYNKDQGTIGKKGGAQLIYYLNIGTIPSDSSYRVFSEKGVPLGKLSDNFVERLTSGDVFILGGHSYEFMHTRGTRVFVRNATGMKPTVPSWSGEMLPRSYDLSKAVGRFRRKLEGRLDDDMVHWLMDEYHIDRGSANTIISYFRDQAAFSPKLPTDKRILIEGYMDQNNKYSMIFHACFGRRVNDALSRAYAYQISRQYNCSTKVSVTDDNFSITTGKEIPLEVVSRLVTSDNIESAIKRAVRNTELFNQRFMHCAGRGFMILRNYKGREISVSKQKMRSSKLLELLDSYPGHPIIQEAYNEILYQVLDLKNAVEVLQDIERGDIEIHTHDYSETPSPFAHNVVMVGISDVVMMEDRSALLRQFHQRVLERVFTKEEIKKFQFETEMVEEHYFGKRPYFDSKEGMLGVIKKTGPLKVFSERGNNIFLYTDRPFDEVQNWGSELLNESKIQSIWMKEVKWVAVEELPVYLACLDRGDMPENSTVVSSIEETKKTKREIFKETDLRLKDVDALVRELEIKRLVNRQGISRENEYRYGLLPPSEVDLESVEKVVTKYLVYEAPRSLEEISFALSIPEDRTLEALDNLVEQGKVVTGKLVIGEGKQYMLQEDYHEFRFPGKERISEEVVAEYLTEKNFGAIDTIPEYFDTFCEASTPFEVYQRVEDFTLDEWNRLRREGELIEGRFVNGRVSYVRSEDVPLYVGAYREEELTEEEDDVLDLIRKGKANTLRELKKASKLSGDTVKEIVNKLDSNLHIYREFTGDEGWSSTNKYRVIDTKIMDREIARETILMRFIRGNGPVLLNELCYYTGFGRWEVEPILSGQLQEEAIVKVIVGDSQREMYLMTDELDGLHSVEGSEVEKMRILSRSDPYTRPMWAEIYSRYGDDWIYPLVKNRRVMGAIEKWNMSGCVEIRHLNLQDTRLMDQVVNSIDELMDFHRLEGFDIVRIRHFNNQPVSELDHEILAVFYNGGYHMVQGMLVKGNFIVNTYTREEILSYVFIKQGLMGNGYHDPKQAISKMKGIRSDLELRARVDEFSSVDWLYRRGDVLAGKMIPPYVMYALPEDAAIYRRAKEVELNNAMRIVLEIIKEKGPVPLRTIYHLSHLDRDETKSALDDMYNGFVITKDKTGKFLYVPPADMSSKKAKKIVVKWAFENFGIFSAERLSMYLGSDYPMGEIREILGEFVEEEYLSKGFLIEGDDTVHWILTEGLEKIKDLSFQGEIVIPTKDRLNLYLRNEIIERFGLGTCNVVFSGTDMVAGFTATRRDKTLRIKEYEGPKKYKLTIKDWGYKNNMGIREKETKKRVSDYEVRKWYERTRGI